MTTSLEPLPLTRRQKDCYDAIVRLVAEYGRSPTRRELVRAMAVNSSGVVQMWLVTLRERGLIDWQPTQACSIRVLPRGGNYSLPPALQRRVESHCKSMGELPSAFVVD